MARYYFDLKNGTTQRDHAGLDLGSDAEAIARAYVMVDEINARPAAHPGHERYICVIHEDGHEVTRVPVDVTASKTSTPRFKKFS
ncbi:DUF6894 family protein [Tardiphaga sp. 813_E8_N1_3]|uniref:DUF6894 family protein n=1 Tax=Tardiphaga sp. 813_E8_N1_3 TaxID=3240760 RepID=UPI003F288976